MTRERSYLFDNIKAFLIFSTVFAHFLKQNPDFSLDSPGGAVYFMIFSYIMQGFFLVSGYFSKDLDKCHRGAAKNFLLPYVMMVFLVSIVSYALCGKFRGDLAEPSFALWFLFAMFVFRFALKFLVKIPGILYISIALYFISGELPVLDDKWTGSRICCFLVFFLIGYYMNEGHIKKIRGIDQNLTTALIIALIFFGYVIAKYRMVRENVLFLEKPYEEFHYSWYEGMGVRAFIALYFLGWMIVFINMMPDRKLPFSETGKRTITVYLLHIPVRYAFKYTDIAGSGGIDSYVIALTAAVLLTWLFSRKPVFDGYNWIIHHAYMPFEYIWQKIKLLGKRIIY